MSTSSSAQSVPNTRSLIQHILDEQATAWNRGEGPAWDSIFTEDADFINIRGDVFRGREAIGQRHAVIFKGPFRGSHTSVTIRQLIEPAPGVAIVETDQEVTGFAFLPPGIAPTSAGVLETHMKYIAVDRDGRWQIIAAQNTAVLPATAMPT